MEKANPVISSSWAVGVRIDTAHAGEVRFGISQPVQLESAKFTYRVPVAATLDGGVTHANSVVDLGAGERELDYGLSYRLAWANRRTCWEWLHFLNGEHGLPALRKGRNSD